jgi:hypothetical protein
MRFKDDQGRLRSFEVVRMGLSMFKRVLKVARRDGESMSKLTKSSPYRVSVWHCLELLLWLNIVSPSVFIQFA